MEADVLLFCTGYQARFPFLEERIVGSVSCVSHLWKNMIDPAQGDRISFIGFARPNQINLLTTAELQARAMAVILSGGRPLPTPQELGRDIERDRAFLARYYGERAKANPALVDQLYFTESLARFIGCHIPWVKVLSRDWHLAVKLWYSAINGAHHRLQGPGADWHRAAQTIKSTPRFSNRKSARERWLVLTALNLVSFLLRPSKASFRSIGALTRR